jgi:proteic killer suppression protein
MPRVILARVLRSFADKDTERVWRRERSRRLDPTTQRAALRKLLILDAADTLDDARIPPGNRLEKLRGDRAGQHSVRVNQQWRKLRPRAWCSIRPLSSVASRCETATA